MAAGVLYTYPENFRAYKALIAAQYSGADVKVAPNFVFGETNKSSEFLKKFPAGKVPAYESADGKVLLTESNAIAYYVSNAALRGSDVASQAAVFQWASWADGELLPAACAWVFPYLGIMQFNKVNVERAKSDLLAALKVLDEHLLTRTFLVSERVTLADIIVFSTLIHAFQHVLDPSVRSSLVNVCRWFLTMSHQPQVSAVVGSVSLAAAPPVYDAKKYQELSKKDGAKKDKKSEKKEQPKKKEKEEKPAPPADDEFDDKPKESKDPFDSLPKGTFNMDDFKRCYSNEDEAVSIPYFWEKFDPQHYSIWFAEYKYPEELSKVFMSCNLITGMFQRLDKMRKQAFSSVCLFGKDDDSSISGVWVWRGDQLAFTLSPDWQIDYESYDWKKLDPSSDETKQLVQQYFAWSGCDKQGRPFNQGKIFK
ncbi:elongation factor 1-gamma isoform X2 [Danaus plexippus]|uniref:elongation factor 1-gamma isoform X2 n=1 Tax=Danaus plexippus TaxID=13037 RepID=UPI0013C3F7E2|nr:elongation factor 1-gamma isoform X2 [Danaus plexippus]